MAIQHEKSDRIDYWKRLWLLSGCFMIIVILVVGGLTRLNEAGLSITEWEIVSGILPPLSEDAWMEAFEEYRLYPEYQRLNKGMTLSEFQVIYWWEYSHRFASRLLGLLFLVPFLIFLWLDALKKDEIFKLSGIALLGGVQAFLGWYMVQSGLESQPVVSHIRLGFHLLVAFVLFGLLWTMALNRIIGEKKDVFSRQPHNTAFWPMLMAVVVLILVLMQVVLGGWIAGLKAGYLYPTFPTMNSFWVPPHIGSMSPWWIDMSHNPVTVHFLHRLFALKIVFFAIPLIIYSAFSKARLLQLTGLLLFVVIALQIATGAFTVLWYVPAWLSSIHQLGALILFATVLTWMVFIKKYTLELPGDAS